MDEYSKLIYSLVGVAVTSFVGYVIVTLGSLKTRVAVLESKEGGIRDMKKSLDKLTVVVYEIAGKLGISIKGD